MLYSLSSNTYVRFYGPYAYFYDNLSKSELLLKDVDLFRQLFSRKLVDVEILLKKITSRFEDSQRQNIINDFNYIFNLLEGNGFIVTKEKVKAKHFSYENIVPASVTDQSPLPAEETGSPSDVLQGYFFKHPTLFTLSVDLTRACTERCIHCYIPEYKSSPSKISKGRLNSSVSSRTCLNNRLSIIELTKSLAVFLSIATSSLT